MLFETYIFQISDQVKVFGAVLLLHVQRVTINPVYTKLTWRMHLQMLNMHLTLASMMNLGLNDAVCDLYFPDK